MLHSIDTEFWDRGRRHPIELISLGIQSSDGRSYYAVNKDFNWHTIDRARLVGDDTPEWLKKNVYPHLAHPDEPLKNVTKTHGEMRQDLLLYFKNDPSPEFWGYYADWDWLLFVHIFGLMVGGPPPNFPQLCLDVEQERLSMGLPKSFYPKQATTEHNALNDARWTMDCVQAIMAEKKRRGPALDTEAKDSVE